MKFLLPLFLLFAIHSQAQTGATLVQEESISSMEWDKRKRKRKPKATGFINIQGGLILNPVIKEYRSSFKGQTKDYLGFNYINIGFGRQLEKKMQGIELDYLWFEGIQRLSPTFFFEIDGESYSTSTSIHRKKQAIDLSIYHAFKITNGDRLHIFAGPLVALGIAREIHSPYNSNSFASMDQDVRLGIGAKINVQLPLSKKLFFSTGTKLLLVDFGRHQDKVANPSIPVRNQSTYSFQFKFLRSQFYLPIGLTFMLGK